MKPLNKFELWIISIITNNRYYLVIADDEETLENARNMEMGDMISVFSSIKRKLEEVSGREIILTFAEPKRDSKKKVRKTVKKVAKKHE